MAIVMIRSRREQRSKNSKIIETAKKFADLNDKLIEQNERILKKNGILMDKEEYLLNAINDSMEVKEPKRFLVHKLSIAPYEPVDYTTKKTEVD